MIEALIFDVDGTLADTEEVHRTAFNRAFDDAGLAWYWDPQLYQRLLRTAGGKERMAAYIDEISPPAAVKRRLLALLPAVHEQKTRFYADAVSAGALALRPGVRRLIDEALAAGCKLAIASTTTAANVDALLQSTLGDRGIDLFSVIACGDQVPLKKPAPDIYQLALRTLGLPADRAVAFEDSVPGLRAAQGAGLWTVVTPTFWTQDSDFSMADLLLPSLGNPADPVPGEPGERLQRAAWLGFDELAARANAANAAHAAT